MLVFAVLVYGTMKWIWPVILGAMEERSRKIAQGLAAAEQGEQELAEARDKADAIIREARERASHIIEQAQHAARDLVEQAKGAARSEGARILQAPGARDRRPHARRSPRQAHGADLTRAPWLTGSPSPDPTPARPSPRHAARSVSSPGPRRCGWRPRWP